MNAYDIQLAIQRRKLLALLKYQKAYMDRIHIEYTGETFKTHVRPSLPLKLTTCVDNKIDVNIKDAMVRKSIPTELEINLLKPDFGLTIGMGTPLTYEFEGGTVDITNRTNFEAGVGFLDPTPVKNDNLQINVEVAGRVKELPLPPIGTFDIPITTQINAPFAINKLPLTRTYLDNLEMQADFEGNIDGVKIQTVANTDIKIGANYEYISNISLANMPELHSETKIKASILDDAAVSLIDMPSVSTETKIEAAVFDKIAVSEYYLVTLNKIGNETLSSLADMPINALYVDNSVVPPIYEVVGN